LFRPSPLPAGVHISFEGKEVSGKAIVWMPYVTTKAIAPLYQTAEVYQLAPKQTSPVYQPGLTPNQGPPPDEHTELIVHPDSTKLLRDHLDGINISHHSSLDYDHTSVHDVPSPCQEMQATLGSVTYDLPYCIKNGKAEVVAVFDNKMKKSLLVEIDAIDDGWIEIDLIDVISSTGPIKEDYVVLVDGKRVIHDEAYNHDRRYVTVPFAAGSEVIQIGEPSVTGPPVVKPICVEPQVLDPETNTCVTPEDTPWLIWLIIAIAIAIGIAIVYWIRTRQ